MSKELVVSATRHEMRVAVLEEDQLVEIYHQREQEYSLAGSIHKGRVTRVLPGMQSAFVDIGLDRDAFLYVSDFFEDNDEYDQVVSTVEDKVLKMDKGGSAHAAAPPTSPLIVVPAEAGTSEAVEPQESVPAATEAAVPDATPPAPPERESGPRQDRGDRGDRGDRRRGRRRRGRGGRGFPESKYAPAGGAIEAAETRPEPAERDFVERAEPRYQPAEAPEDVLILPGESLAKYRGAPPDSEASAGEPGQHATAGEVAELVAEAVEAERHDAEIHEAAIHVEDAPVEEPAAVSIPEPAASATVEPPAASSVSEVWPELESPQPDAPGGAERQNRDGQKNGAAPEIEAELEPEAGLDADGGLNSESSPDGEEFTDPEDLTENEVLTGNEVLTESEAPAEGEASPEVEPARIPTSLTATLREQGLRYPHRVSRRSRRRQRGGPEEGGRTDRGDRPDRGERPERGDRGAAGPPREEQRQVARPDRGERPPQPSIADLLKEGQEIIVQIAKEPLGAKGARITSYVALPGRYVVYMPTVEHVGVSRKIGSDDERLRLKRILQKHREGIPGGFILRTAGEGKTEEELRSDMHFLYNLWMEIRAKAEKRKAPALVYHDLDVVERVLRDQLTASFKSITVDNEEVYERVLRFVERFQPSLVSRVKLYTRSVPIFDSFNITQELEKALRPKVWLKSGGYIVINQTEALVAIDINTGKYVGKSNRLEDTIVKTNTDAVKEIVRQIRLRDLGGIIVVDFIDMDERKNRQKVMQALEEAMRADKAPNKILQFNDFGLVAITRKRVKQSLERTLCSPCPYCEGAGYVKSVGTIIGEIIQEAHKIAKAVEGPDVLLRVSPEVAKTLKSNKNEFLQELEEILKRTVFVKSDPTLHQEKFDLA